MKLTFTEMTYAHGDKSTDFIIDDTEEGAAAVAEAMLRFKTLMNGNFAFTSGKDGAGKRLVRSLDDIGIGPDGEDREVTFSPVLTGG